MHLHLQIILGHDAECGDIALKRGSAAPHSRGSRDDLVYLLASFLMQLSAPSSFAEGILLRRDWTFMPLSLYRVTICIERGCVTSQVK